MAGFGRGCLGIDADGYFLSEEDAYGALETVSRRRGGKVRALLVAQELVEFCPYSQLGDEEKKEYKGLKESGSWVKHEFPRRQDAVDLDAVRSLEKRCGTRFRELSGALPKLLVGGAIVVVAAVGTGGVAAALAPDIAVGIFGGSFVGLHGAALVNASLAVAGGGALAAGGMGMAGGTALITGGGAALGLLGSGGVAWRHRWGRTTRSSCSSNVRGSLLFLMWQLTAARMRGPFWCGRRPRPCGAASLVLRKISGRRMERGTAGIAGCLSS